MLYTEKAATGDAGEFFFAYQIAYVLKWPCRLFDIDIGIDAQVEVLDEKQQSTGRFVGFQVKARGIPDEANAKYVTERQLEYWKFSDVPVFVVLVHLPARKMYLHRVRKDYQYPAATDTGLVRIEFDLKKDRFSAASRALIAEASKEEKLAEIECKLDEARAEIERIQKGIKKDNPNIQFWLDRVHRLDFFEQSLAQAGALVESHKVGDAELKDAWSQWRKALRSLRDYLVENDIAAAAVGHTNAGEISEFIALYD